MDPANDAPRAREPLGLAPLLTLGHVAREGSFTRAAESLGLSQPAVSQHVRALERHFGVRLVDLVGRRVVLTAAGSFLAERAARIVDSVAATERDMRHYADVQMGELRLGSTVTIGEHTLTPLLQRFRQSYPEIIVCVTIHNTSRIAAMLKAGELELALIEGPLNEADDLEIIPYADDELVLVVPFDHELSRQPGPITPALIESQPFIMREKGSGTRATVEAALRVAGIAPRVVLELPSGEAITRAVAAGIGISIVSPIITVDALAAGRLTHVAVAGLDLRRTFRVARLRSLTPSPAAKAFATLTLAGTKATSHEDPSSTLW